MNILVRKYPGVISEDVRKTIASRYKTVTKAINKEFWGSESDSEHSFYVGSYGRKTAINTSDIDVLVEIPYSELERFQNMSGNGQSRFLQAVKSPIADAYPRSEVKADGQVIKIDFTDGIQFEIIPAFQRLDGSYVYADTNIGGRWLSSNPKAEQDAMQQKNQQSNGLFNATCRHIRYVRDNYFSSYKLPGILIDTFVYEAMGGWYYPNEGTTSSPSGTYELSLLNYFEELETSIQFTFIVPGSDQRVDGSGSAECLRKVLEKIVL